MRDEVFPVLERVSPRQTFGPLVGVYRKDVVGKTTVVLTKDCESGRFRQ